VAGAWRERAVPRRPRPSRRVAAAKRPRPRFRDEEMS
jgi:hypothetical protein